MTKAGESSDKKVGKISEIKGGVIIIGSLFWQDHLNNKPELRKNWRKNSLDLKKKILAKLPIRYGRCSRGNVYTMVFSTACETGRLGTGYIIPFKANPIKNLDILISEARKMSKAEGMSNKFVGGNQSIWGSMGILINRNKVPPILAEKIANKWSILLKADGGGQDSSDYRVGRERRSINQNGELLIKWPGGLTLNDNDKINEFDVLIAASTKPEYEDRAQMKYPSAVEIAKSVKNDNSRHYFLNNYFHNIGTFQDSKVINLI